MSSQVTIARLHHKSTDMRVTYIAVFFLPVETRVPLKFGSEILRSVTCCRVQATVCDRRGREASGWGETPLSVQWAWPSDLSIAYRTETMQRFVQRLASALVAHAAFGHPMELGFDFQQSVLPVLLKTFNANRQGARLPYLAALICLSALDIALHDAFGALHDIDVYDAYTPEYMNRDLSHFIAPANGIDVNFAELHPADFLAIQADALLPVWHLVGGLDPLTPAESADSTLAHDGYPEFLADWIVSDGLKCLKVKLRGDDAEWDYQRLVRVGEIAFPLGVKHLSADFNCTVEEPSYVNGVLDRLARHHPETYNRILFVEQPFPYDLEAHRIDVRSVAERKPIFLDESAHDWRYVRLGRSLGWTGVCLKTCKTQTGSLLSLCWAKAHGMDVMVQDLTNPMLAQIPHVRLAAKAQTIMGVESNAMQFYPEASLPEAAVHPGLYRRRDGQLNLSTLKGSGFGYRLSEIQRTLPTPAITVANVNGRVACRS